MTETVLLILILVALAEVVKYIKNNRLSVQGQGDYF